MPGIDVFTSPLMTTGTVPSVSSVANAPISVYVSPTFKLITASPSKVTIGEIVSPEVVTAVEVSVISTTIQEPLVIFCDPLAMDTQ